MNIQNTLTTRVGVPGLALRFGLGYFGRRNFPEDR